MPGSMTGVDFVDGTSAAFAAEVPSLRSSLRAASAVEEAILRSARVGRGRSLLPFAADGPCGGAAIAD